MCSPAGQSELKWARNCVVCGGVSDEAQLSGAVVFRRAEGAGDVARYFGAYNVLGGNQSDGVTITRIARDHCIAMRRPVYKAVPASATPIQLAANGALSTHEA